jgi:hypothetical protein
MSTDIALEYRIGGQGGLLRSAMLNTSFLPTNHMALVEKRLQVLLRAFRGAAGTQRRINTETTDKERPKQIARQYEMTAHKRGSLQEVREAMRKGSRRLTCCGTLRVIATHRL